MEPFPNQSAEPSLFGFGIDQASRAHLSEAVKWARFLAIVGFVMCGIIVLMAIFAGSILAMMPGLDNEEFSGSSAMRTGVGAFVTIFYIGIAVLFFFPYLFLLRFANHMRTALNTNDQQTLNSSFQNLKIMFRYVGILTIVSLSFYGLALIMVLISAAATGFN